MSIDVRETKTYLVEASNYRDNQKQPVVNVEREIFPSHAPQQSHIRAIRFIPLPIDRFCKRRFVHKTKVYKKYY